MSLGALPGGSFGLDTDVGGGGVIVSQGGGLPDIAVFTFDGGSVLGAGETISVTGSNGLAILFKGTATISGTIDVSGAQPILSSTGPLGIAGGGKGGNSSVFNAMIDVGGGPGGGLEGSTSAVISGAGPGSGAGFGTVGGLAGAGVTFRAGGGTYGDLAVALQAGSGGGGGGGYNAGSSNGGGAGGGTIEIGALTNLNFVGASILLNGGNGGNDVFGSGYGGGGGSGGGLLIHSFNINIDASSLLQANGGIGGRSGSAEGGCGGAGRIAILHNTAGSLVNSGIVESMSGVGREDCGVDPVTPVTLALADIGEAPTGIPEPSVLAILAFGLVGVGFRAMRR